MSKCREAKCDRVAWVERLIRALLIVGSWFMVALYAVPRSLRGAGPQQGFGEIFIFKNSGV